MRTAVIGLGNRDRGDDAVGLLVADDLAVRLTGADVFAWERPELDLLEVLPRYDRVVVVDAARSGAPTGTIHVDPVLPAADVAGTHGFGIHGVLELAAALDRLPDQVHLALVEIGPATHGEGLSDEVATAAEQLVAHLTSVLAGGDADVPG